MSAPVVSRIEPAAELQEATRAWLVPVRGALGAQWLASYYTGSVLLVGFDPRRSPIDVLVVAKHLDADTLDALGAAIPHAKKPPHFKPLFLTRTQIEKSLDVFPIEFLDIQERRLLIEGEDVFAGLEVPRTHLRLQCEHELRGKHLRLRQAYLAAAGRGELLEATIKELASSFATLFRTLLRLRGEAPPTDREQVIERLAAVYRLDARALLNAHHVRYGRSRFSPDEVRLIYRNFLVEIDRLVTAIDELHIP